MKLVDLYAIKPKELVYDRYMRIVYNIKDYDNISRKKMAEEIIKEYSQKGFMYEMCTTREINFLKYATKHEITSKDFTKYLWEIRTLHDKCIFDIDKLEIYEEQKANVEDTLKIFKERKVKQNEDFYVFIVGYIKTVGSMFTKALDGVIESLIKIDRKDIGKLYGNPMFHFYCEFTTKYFELNDIEEEMVSYRDYYHVLDELDDARMKYGISGALPINMQDYSDIFYYDFPIRKPAVKKMYDLFKNSLIALSIFYLVDEARILNDRSKINKYFKGDTLKIINDALNDIPCAAMNGFTPNEHHKEMLKKIDISKEFKHIPQNNACLCKNAADDYYKLYFALLEYVNNIYNIVPELKKIYKQLQLDSNKLRLIDEYLWEHKDIIDDFIKDNPYNFTEDELKEIKEFKNAVSSKCFIIVGFDREYTKVLSNDGKLYMIKGIRGNLDRILNPEEMPIVIGATLLMFRGQIIYNGIFNSVPIDIGNDMKMQIAEDMKKSIPHYHL